MSGARHHEQRYPALHRDREEATAGVAPNQEPGCEHHAGGEPIRGLAVNYMLEVSQSGAWQ